MPLMLSETLPVLVRVTVCEGLVVPTVWLAKVSELGVSVAVGTATPVPLRLAVLVPAEVLSLTVTVAERDPVVAGVNVTVMVQMPPAGRLPTQLLFWLKSPGLAPPSVMLLTVSEEAPVFVRVRYNGELVLPTVWLAKVTVPGRSVAVTAEIPVPLRLL
jgi:hypothetical protein